MTRFTAIAVAAMAGFGAQITALSAEDDHPRLSGSVTIEVETGKSYGVPRTAPGLECEDQAQSLTGTAATSDDAGYGHLPRSRLPGSAGCISHGRDKIEAY